MLGSRFGFLRHIAAFVLAFGAPAVAQERTPSPIVIDGKFDAATDLLLIPVRIGAARLWCAPDTGLSGLLVVDPAHAAGLAIGAGRPYPDGTPANPVDRSATADVSIGPILLGAHHVIVRDLADEAPEMECAIGGGLLRRYVMEFDYTTPRLRLFEPAAFQPPPGAMQVPLIFRTNPNVPFVRVNIRMADGTEHMTQLVADTGTASYAAAFVDPAASRIRGSVGVTAALPHVVKGPLGPLQVSAARPAAMVIGPVTLSQPVVALIESHLSPGVDDGTLGCGFFRRFTVTFDYGGQRLFLQPTGRTDAPHLFDASGAGFEQSAGGFVVANVLSDTAAARSGLRKGDRLLDIDGSRADSLTLVALRNLFSKPGETRQLAIERDGKRMAIALALTKRL
jgi:hypothetical protein